MSAEPKQTSPDSAADDQYELRVTHAANRTGDCKGWEPPFASGGTNVRSVLQ